MYDGIKLFLEWVGYFFIAYLIGYSTFLFLSVVVGSLELYKHRRQEMFKSILPSDYYLPISIIVPAYNEEVTVVDTVRSLLTLEYRAYEIIVVDDGSKDRTSDTLHVGDFVSAGSSSGKVRAMIDDKGRRVKEAGPSMPVEILGLSDVPEAGDVFLAHESDKEAKSYAEAFIEQNKEKKLEETKSRMSLDDLFNQIQEGNLKELNLIVKADVQGSVEAVKQSLTKLSNEEIVVKCIHGGVGAINESDVTLASASNAIIIGFNVRPDATAKATAETEGVDIRLYKVIYQAIEDVEAAMKGMLDPVYEEKIIGHAEVRQIFKASAIGNIAGSYVLDGVFTRGCKVRITREGELIYEGALASLKRFKDDVKEVKAGFECGLVFEGFDKMKEFDVVEAYIMVEVPR